MNLEHELFAGSSRKPTRKPTKKPAKKTTKKSTKKQSKRGRGRGYDHELYAGNFWDDISNTFTDAVNTVGNVASTVGKSVVNTAGDLYQNQIKPHMDDIDKVVSVAAKAAPLIALAAGSTKNKNNAKKRYNNKFLSWKRKAKAQGLQTKEINDRIKDYKKLNDKKLKALLSFVEERFYNYLAK